MRDYGPTLDPVTVGGRCDTDGWRTIYKQDAPDSVNQPRIGAGQHPNREDPSYAFSSSWYAAGDSWTTGRIDTPRFRCNPPEREGCLY